MLGANRTPYTDLSCVDVLIHSSCQSIKWVGWVLSQSKTKSALLQMKISKSAMLRVPSSKSIYSFPCPSFSPPHYLGSTFPCSSLSHSGYPLQDPDPLSCFGYPLKDQVLPLHALLLLLLLCPAKEIPLRIRIRIAQFSSSPSSPSRSEKLMSVVTTMGSSPRKTRRRCLAQFSVHAHTQSGGGIVYLLSLYSTFQGGGHHC